MAKQKEFADKLEEVCDDLTLTENQLLGHQQQAEKAECVTDLQQYQQEHQVLYCLSCLKIKNLHKRNTKAVLFPARLQGSAKRRADQCQCFERGHQRHQKVPGGESKQADTRSDRHD